MTSIIRVLYDHQIFAMQKFGGISRYFVELIKQFEHTDSVFTMISIKYSDNYYLKDINISTEQLKILKNNKFEKQIMYGLNIIPSIHQVSENNFDIFHPTYYGSYYSNFIKRKPIVLTVHDLTHEKYPHFFSKPERNSQMKRKSFELANRIIAISENTKQDIVNYFGIDPMKIDVIYHGNSLKSKFEILKKEEDVFEELRYLLFVGVRGGYKNFSYLIDAIAPILRKDDSLKIICAGGGELNAEEIAQAYSLGINNKIIQIKVTDNELIKLYKNAIAFVFPSLYEGFGMPILEAMDCGCPIILSNTSSFPEIAGAAGEYFDPFEEESIRTSVEKVIYNEEYRKILKKLGNDRAKLFSWEDSANKTQEVYKKAIEQKL